MTNKQAIWCTCGHHRSLHQYVPEHRAPQHCRGLGCACAVYLSKQQARKQARELADQKHRELVLAQYRQSR